MRIMQNVDKYIVNTCWSKVEVEDDLAVKAAKFFSFLGGSNMASSHCRN